MCKYCETREKNEINGKEFDLISTAGFKMIEDIVAG